MDRALRSLLGILIVALVASAAFVSFSAYVHAAYERTLSSRYVYEISLETDAVLSNVTLFVPLPERHGGRSPILERIGEGDLYGIPRDWETEIYGTEKFSMLMISADEILPQFGPPPLPASEEENLTAAPAATPVPVPVTIRVEADAGAVIDTRHPIGNSSVILPKYDLSPVPCPFPHGEEERPPACYTYETSVYADYTAGADAAVTITVSLTGTNEWFIFGWTGNEFRDRLTLALDGEVHGWQRANGTLMTGIGQYEIL